MPLVTPLSAGCRGKCVIDSLRARFSAWVSDRFDIDKIKHTFSKREQISSSAYHKHLALMQTVFRAYSTSCYTGRGLAGHLRRVRMGNVYNKMRLFTPIRSKTTTLRRCGHHHSAQQGRCSPAHRGDESAGNGSHRNHSSGPERVRLLNHILVKRSFRMITLKQILSQICPGDWFMSLDLKDAYFHIQIAPDHRRFLRFAFEGVGGISIQGPHVWAVLGSRHFYAMHGCSSLSSATDGNPHPQLQYFSSISSIRIPLKGNCSIPFRII